MRQNITENSLNKLLSVKSILYAFSFSFIFSLSTCKGTLASYLPEDQEKSLQLTFSKAVSSILKRTERCLNLANMVETTSPSDDSNFQYQCTLHLILEDYLNIFGHTVMTVPIQASPTQFLIPNKPSSSPTKIKGKFETPCYVLDHKNCLGFFRGTVDTLRFFELTESDPPLVLLTLKDATAEEPFTYTDFAGYLQLDEDPAHLKLYSLDKRSIYLKLHNFNPADAMPLQVAKSALRQFLINLDRAHTLKLESRLFRPNNGLKRIYTTPRLPDGSYCFYYREQQKSFFLQSTQKTWSVPLKKLGYDRKQVIFRNGDCRIQLTEDFKPECPIEPVGFLVKNNMEHLDPLNFIEALLPDKLHPKVPHLTPSSLGLKDTSLTSIAEAKKTKEALLKAQKLLRSYQACLDS